ncbi:Regulator of vps4 activity in the mvb pathway protein, partial [Thalictrum thalictroides]
FDVEHVIREQNIMAANEIIDVFCELVVARLSIIAKQRECPADLKEGISSLIFAAPRCSDIPELLQMRAIFEKKYGKEFVNAATELRPSCGVNRTLIDKLSVRTPTGEVKLKLMKEIAKEYQIAWDHTESEKELLKPPEELIKGPSNFVNAASLPVKSYGAEPNQSTSRLSNDGQYTMHFEDTASAAKVAAESAEKAVAAAQAAAYLANRDQCQVFRTTSFTYGTDRIENSIISKKNVLGNSTRLPMSSDSPGNFQDRVNHGGLAGRTYESQDYNRSRSTYPPGNFQDSVNHTDHAGRTYESQDYDRSRSTYSLGNFQDRANHSELPGRTIESQDYDRSRSTDPPGKFQDRVNPSDIAAKTNESQDYDRSRPTDPYMLNDPSKSSQNRWHHPDLPGKMEESHSFDRSYSLGDEDRRIHRRHTYNAPAVHSNIKFDESDDPDSDWDEEIEMEKPPGDIHPPPHRPPPPLPPAHAYQPDDRSQMDNSSSYRRNSLPRVHPKLPDYVELTSRFEALKFRKT